jgi:hypothetical protein
VQPHRHSFRHSSRRAWPRAAAIIALYLTVGLAPHQASAAARLNCFSDICLGDPPSVLNTVTLSDLSRIVRRSGVGQSGAGRSGADVDLKAALPATSADDRKTLAERVDDNGRFLVDQKTMRIFLGIKGVCAPTAPFVALFTSDSGHITSVVFDVIETEGQVRLGVKRIARAFLIKPATPAYIALIADLSAKFGFKVGDEPVHKAADGVSAAYEELDQGFRLALSMPDLKNRNVDIASQTACAPLVRVKID